MSPTGSSLIEPNETHKEGGSLDKSLSLEDEDQENPKKRVAPQHGSETKLKKTLTTIMNNKKKLNS